MAVGDLEWRTHSHARLVPCCERAGVCEKGAAVRRRPQRSRAGLRPSSCMKRSGPAVGQRPLPSQAQQPISKGRVCFWVLQSLRGVPWGGWSGRWPMAGRPRHRAALGARQQLVHRPQPTPGASRETERAEHTAGERLHSAQQEINLKRAEASGTHTPRPGPI